MSFEFAPAKRENVPLLLGLAGGTGSGKTYSAMVLAKGLAAGNRFAVIDTENGRARHYADEFEFDCADLRAPFSPTRYAEAIEAADKAGYPVIVVDSMSHEHAGDGGLLDMHEAEFQRMGGKDTVKMTAWIKPKGEHKKMVTRLLQVRAHVILCFRAEEKIDIVKGSDGKTKIVPKASLVGLDGWVPVSEKTLPYELTASFLLTASHPGVPKPIKLQEQHKPFFPLDRTIGEDAGRMLGEWAAGGSAPSPARARAAADETSGLTVPELRARLADLGVANETVAAVGARLFPGQSAGSLTNEGRQELLEAIESEEGDAWGSFGDNPEPVAETPAAAEEPAVEREIDQSPFQPPASVRS